MKLLKNYKWLLIPLAAGLLVAATLWYIVPKAGASQNQEGQGCQYTCPVVHFEWQTTVYDNCPSGYSVKSGHEDQCKKDENPNKNSVITRPSHEVSHSANVQYNKSEDPLKCHRPSDNDLKDDYGMDNDARQAFKAANSEWKDSDLVENSCPVPTATPTPTVIPTVTPTPTPEDECWKDECEVSPTPSPTPEVTPTPEQRGSNPPETHDNNAPVCTDGSLTSVVSNLQVARNGSEAVVSFFVTQGDGANIFYKESNSQGWQFSVPDLKAGDNGYVSYTIQGLKAGVDYDFGVQQKVGCGGGQIVTSFVHDSFLTQIFRLTKYIW